VLCCALGCRGGVPSESFALTLSVPAAAAFKRRLPSWRRWPWFSIYTLGWGLALREKSLVPDLGGRWRRLRRNLLGGFVLEAMFSYWCVFFSLSGWWMSGQRPRADDVCMSRRRPREPWWSTASWGAAVAWLGLGDNLVSLGRKDCRLGRRVPVEAV
jgi:hypothetical protein